MNPILRKKYRKAKGKVTKMKLFISSVGIHSQYKHTHAHTHTHTQFQLYFNTFNI